MESVAFTDLQKKIYELSVLKGKKEEEEIITYRLLVLEFYKPGPNNMGLVNSR